MKYTLHGLLRKIQGRELSIKNAKNLTRHYGYIVKEKALVPGIVGAIALAAGATLGFFLPKRKTQKKNLEIEQASLKRSKSRSRAVIGRLFDAVAVVSTLSSIVAAVTRTIKK